MQTQVVIMILMVILIQKVTLKIITTSKVTKIPLTKVLLFCWFAPLFQEVFLGWLVLPVETLELLGNMATWFLGLLLLGVGLDLGLSNTVFQSIKEQGTGILLLPLGVALGSIIGSLGLIFFYGRLIME